MDQSVIYVSKIYTNNISDNVKMDVCRNAQIERSAIPMVGILNLPVEIQEEILKCPHLKGNDVRNFALTCKQLNWFFGSESLWKNKFLCRWPELGHDLLQLSGNSKAAISWIRLYRDMITVLKEVNRLLDELTTSRFFSNGVPRQALKDLYHYVSHIEYGEMFVDIVVKGIINDGSPFNNLSRKLYAAALHEQIHFEKLKKKFYSIDYNRPSAAFEDALVIDEWFDVHGEHDGGITYQQLLTMVREELVQISPHHPALTRTRQHLLTRLTPQEDQDVLEGIKKVLFTRLGFTDTGDDFYNVQNSFIKMVLHRRRGLPIMLCIVFSCLAQELGVNCKLINFPEKIIVCWKSVQGSSVFIDVYDKCKYYTQHNVLTLLHEDHYNVHNVLSRPAKATEVSERILLNIERAAQEFSYRASYLKTMLRAKELSVFRNPMSELDVLYLVKYYIQHEVHLEEVEPVTLPLKEHMTAREYKETFGNYISMAEHLIKTAKNKRLEPKYRSGFNKNEGVCYRVGMIMHHNRYLYLCVIYGWDPVCRMSQAWQNQMGVPCLRRQDKQPFYNVLVNDGSTRYAAQENLNPTQSLEPIAHQDIGKYFKKAVLPTHYIPNDVLKQGYPEDDIYW